MPTRASIPNGVEPGAPPHVWERTGLVGWVIRPFMDRLSEDFSEVY